MKQSDKKKITNWLIVLVIAYGASIFAGKVYKSHVEPRQIKLSALDGEPFPGLRDSQDASSDYQQISQTLLIDSILTIVRNYYVDTHRLSSRELLERTLFLLTENNDVRLRTVNDNLIHLRAEGGQLELRIPENYSFDHLARHAGQIARILDSPVPAEVETGAAQRSAHRSANYSRGTSRFLNAMLQSLDSHSSLLNREEYRDLRQGTEGSFGGLGVVVGIKDDLLTVIKPLPESPASRAGINRDDKIMSINDVMTFGSTLDHLVQHMRGAPGTTVRLSLLREGEYAPVEISLQREIIQVSSVEASLIEGRNSRVLHLLVESFSSRTAREISRNIARFQSRGPLDAIILDLRSNPGGLLDQAVQVADLFLSQGDIVSTVGRRKEVEKAYPDSRDVRLPLVVLINSESASASEIVAGALQDNNRAVVVGQPSFGKGSVQTVFELPGEKALKLTIARYYTPSGRSIQSVGILPDIWLQPVFAEDVNRNLLGRDRYRNEQILNRRFLEQDRSRRELVTDEMRIRKGYFLASANEEEDYVLSFAHQLVDDLIAKNQRPVPQERLRSSYWLANSHSMIKGFLQKSSLSVEQWIQNRFHLDWRVGAPVNTKDLEQLEFKIQADGQLEVFEGQTIRLPWSLVNHGEKSVGRISIFVLPESSYMQTHEILVGMVQPKQTIRGFVELPVNLSSSHRGFHLSIGAAVDSYAMPSSISRHEVSIKSRDHPSLSFDVRLVDERGGRLAGVLEPGEIAAIEIIVENQSTITAREVMPVLTNLTGKQVVLSGNFEIEAFDLRAFESHRVRIPIQAAEQLFHRKLHFGLTIESADLLRPIKGSFHLDGEAGYRTARKGQVIK